MPARGNPQPAPHFDIPPWFPRTGIVLPDQAGDRLCPYASHRGRDNPSVVVRGIPRPSFRHSRPTPVIPAEAGIHIIIINRIRNDIPRGCPARHSAPQSSREQALSPTVIVGAGPCARPRKPTTRPSFRHPPVVPPDRHSAPRSSRGQALSPTVIVGAGPCARPRKPTARPSFRHSRPTPVIPAEAGIHIIIINRTRNDILHGTLQYFSSSRVRVSGVPIQNREPCTAPSPPASLPIPSVPATVPVPVLPGPKTP